MSLHSATQPFTLCYKAIDDLEILADVHFPEPGPRQSAQPVFIYLHGGGWVGGCRKEFCPALFHELLFKGFVVVSLDYRLLPEASLNDLFDDLRDAEQWVKVILPKELKYMGYLLDTNAIVVGGSSAGAHLALMVPHLWKDPPAAVMSIYGPTNMATLGVRDIFLEQMSSIPILSPASIGEAVQPKPISSTEPPKSGQSFLNPRSLLGLELFRQSLMPEFLLQGLGQGLTLPIKGSVSQEELVAISPELLDLTSYPPTYQVLGTADALFEERQVTSFTTKLEKAGISCETLLVADAGHAFDILAKPGGDIHTRLIVPAVQFLLDCLGPRKRGHLGRGTVHCTKVGDGLDLRKFELTQ